MDKYHNTETLLKKYRDVAWNIEVANMQMNMDSHNPINELLDISYSENVQIKEQTKTIEKNKKILSLIDRALELIRNKQKYGRDYYQVLYYTFITNEPLSSTAEIVDKLCDEGCCMTDKTYFRRKNEAIKLLSEILFGP